MRRGIYCTCNGVANSCFCFFLRLFGEPEWAVEHVLFVVHDKKILVWFVLAF